ncbi:MAG: hypothetical protein ABEJ31_02160 [Haloarculaceae archaeon]
MSVTHAEGGGDGSDTTGEELTYDAIFFTLSNARRRYLLHHLKRYEEPVSVGDLAREVAAWENDVPVEAVTHAQRKRAYSSLHQTHLPKMADLGIVDYDRERGVVTPTEPIDKLDFYLEVIPNDGIAWHEYYLAVSAIAVVLSVLSALEVAPFEALSAAAAAVLVSAFWFASAAVNAYYARGQRFGDGELPANLR